MGEVHADHIETSSAQLVDGLDAVGLGANGADDGGSAVVLLGLVGGVEGGKPGNLASQVKVLLSSSGHDAVGSLSERLDVRHSSGGKAVLVRAG